MSGHALITLLVYVLVLLLLARPLGEYMARVASGDAFWARRGLGGIERACYRVAGVDPGLDMSWRHYARALLAFNLLGMLLVYALLRAQHLLPLNPNGLPAVAPGVAFNTAVSFATNTNWQAYAGETTMSHLTQMLGLTVQNFVSAGTGLAVLFALARGFSRRNAAGIGNFWVDLTRSVLYVLLPMSVVFALFLVSRGVIQTFSGSVVVPGWSEPQGQVAEQIIALGPVASQVAIKQLGTNGGGFFNANAAHPLENPDAISNFLQLVAILLIPAALCFTFGDLVNKRRQGWAILIAMLILFLPLAGATIVAEQAGNPALRALSVDDAASADQSGGNMEGKETRFGITSSALWAVATTAASNGSVNAMHDSFTPLGGAVPLLLMQLGEVVFGGVGSGLYGMIVMALLAVFIAGLMVGRTPEFLGKKIEAFEMKMASLVVLGPAAAVLLGTAIACVVRGGTASLGNPGAHGFSEILYAFSSGANNNGSAFAGLGVSGTFYTTAIGLCMLVGRYWVILPVLAIAGGLARKNAVPVGAGTLATDTPLFVLLLVGVVLLIGALTFVPALAIGPVVEHLSLFQ